LANSGRFSTRSVRILRRAAGRGGGIARKKKLGVKRKDKPERNDQKNEAAPHDHWKDPEVLARQKSYGEFLRSKCPLDDEEKMEKLLDEVGDLISGQDPAREHVVVEHVTNSLGLREILKGLRFAE
jgi:hypothetical protein